MNYLVVESRFYFQDYNQQILLILVFIISCVIKYFLFSIVNSTLTMTSVKNGCRSIYQKPCQTFCCIKVAQFVSYSTVMKINLCLFVGCGLTSLLKDKYPNFEVGLKCILTVNPYLLVCSYIIWKSDDNKYRSWMLLSATLLAHPWPIFGVIASSNALNWSLTMALQSICYC